jgi:hypothetical protein
MLGSIVRRRANREIGSSWPRTRDKLLEAVQPRFRRIDILREADETKPDAAQSAIINWTMRAETAAWVNVACRIRKFEFRFRQNVDRQIHSSLYQAIAR